MAKILGLREKTLMQRVRRGSFPAPDSGTPRSQKWSRDLIASDQFTEHLPEGTIVPPHWKTEPQTTTFIGTRSLRSSRGEACALLIFDVGGIRTGILYTPDVKANEVHVLEKSHPDFFDCDIIYQPDGLVDLSDLPEMTYGVRSDTGIVSATSEQGESTGIWKDLAETMGMALPFWPNRLRQMSDILAWTPERSAPNSVALVPTDSRWEKMSMIEPFAEDEYRPLIDAQKEYFLRGSHGDSDAIMRDITYSYTDADPKLFTIPVTAQPFFEMTDDEIALADASPGQITLRDDAPLDNKYLISSATAIMDNSRFGRPAFDAMPALRSSSSNPMSVGRLTEWMLAAATEDVSEKMSATLFGISRGGLEMIWRSIPGSNGYVLERRAMGPDQFHVIAPTRIEGIGEVREIVCPTDPTGLTLFSDDRGYVWPVPVRDCELSSGYVGSGPQRFAQIVLRLLTHDGTVDLDDDDITSATLTDPDSGREFTAYAAPDDPGLAPFAGAAVLGEVITRDAAIREFVRTGEFIE